MLAAQIDKTAPSQATFNQAYPLALQGLRTKPDSSEVRSGLAEVLMRHGEFRQAIEQLEWLTAPERGQHNPRFEYLLFACFAKQDYYDQAIEVLGQMIGYDPATHAFRPKPGRFPTEIVAYRYLAGILRDNVQPPQPHEADEIMDRMVSANPNSFCAYLERAKYANHYKGLKSGDDDLAKALKLQPDSAEVILAAAESCAGRKEVRRVRRSRRAGTEIVSPGSTDVSAMRSIEELPRKAG